MLTGLPIRQLNDQSGIIAAPFDRLVSAEKLNVLNFYGLCFVFHLNDQVHVFTVTFSIPQFLHFPLRVLIE